MPHPIFPAGPVRPALPVVMPVKAGVPTGSEDVFSVRLVAERPPQLLQVIVEDVVVGERSARGGLLAVDRVVLGHRHRALGRAAGFGSPAR
ncbi:hypothetical protein [Spirillospora albida]|uniref:hypothetical protein n=1 Tax=Spirillospora albida TaxID=58123 RepID=UPI0004C2ADC6|nr:hypothetical protein [Spirillospora albida]